ncbi:hypothetical protein [Mucilaginibacter sp.]
MSYEKAAGFVLLSPEQEQRIARSAEKSGNGITVQEISSIAPKNN